MIDFEKLTITGKSGKIYRILPKDISAGRFPEYEIRQITLAFNTDFNTVFKTINEVIDVLLKGKDNAQGNTYEAVTKLKNIQSGMVNFAENSRPAIIEFVSLFTIAEGEDVSKHTEEQIKAKYEDWANIPIDAFFLLAAKAIPQFRENLQSQLETHNKESQNI